MVKGKSIKKDRVTVAVGKYRLHSKRNYRLFTEDWKEWKRTMKSLKGNTIGQHQVTADLFQVLERQGFVGRWAGNSGPTAAPWPKEIFDDFKQIDDVFRRQDYTEKHLQMLVDLEKKMGEFQTNKDEHNGNPANILFTEPRNWDDEDGEIADYQPVYGHYLSRNYCDYRNDWKDANITPVDESWYSYNRGEAKPPMWLALYGTGIVLGKNVHSLQKIIQDAIKDLGELDLTLDKNTPIPIHGQGSAKLALEIKEIRKMFKLMVEHEGYTTAQGNFSTTRASTVIKNTPIRIHGQREVNLIKRIETEFGAIPNDIDLIYITMSRRQMLHMAKEMGWKPPEKEEEEEVKTSANVEIHDWRTIMKVSV